MFPKLNQKRDRQTVTACAINAHSPNKKIPLMDALKIIYPRAFKIVTQFPILGDSNQRRGYVNIICFPTYSIIFRNIGECAPIIKRFWPKLEENRRMIPWGQKEGTTASSCTRMSSAQFLV